MPRKKSVKKKRHDIPLTKAIVQYITIQARKYPDKPSGEIYSNIITSQSMNPVLRNKGLAKNFSFIWTTELTPEVIWSLGFLSGKGRINSRNRGTIRLQLRKALELPLHYMCQELKLPLPFPQIITPTNGKNKHGKVVRRKADLVYWNLSLINQDFFEWLDGLNILNFMQGKSLPDISESFIDYFCQGLFVASRDAIASKRKNQPTLLTFRTSDQADRAAELLNLFKEGHIEANGKHIDLTSFPHLVDRIFRRKINPTPEHPDLIRNIEECNDSLFFEPDGK